MSEQQPDPPLDLRETVARMLWPMIYKEGAFDSPSWDREREKTLSQADQLIALIVPETGGPENPYKCNMPGILPEDLEGWHLKNTIFAQGVRADRNFLLRERRG
ncbi:hypothetical protein LCGC14_0637430 [marine sediment metagenome]|uniref:Uncharacterized protein n=1 Tax=marine sediment metagenome TaxID=412755 RepID=A0A0F9RJD5_9ZZZZ